MSATNGTAPAGREIGYVPKDDEELFDVLDSSDSDYFARDARPPLPPELKPFFQQFVKQNAESKRFDLLDDEELGQLEPPEWIIDTVIPANALVVVVGPPKSLKSFLAKDWAFHIAVGMNWHGLPTKRGLVVYIYAEGTAGL